MAQVKGQSKTPEGELSKMETNCSLEAEFKMLVISMLSELRTSTT